MPSPDFLRTPDDRYVDLPGFTWSPHYLDGLEEFDGMRMHYVDEGPRQAQVTFLCLHGQPTWSYLYRRMIPVFTHAGCRVVAPDLFGFGRSDKPVDDARYTFDFHRRSLLAFVEALDLRSIALVCQDWGGLLGLTLPLELPGRITRLVVMNTILGTGDQLLPAGFVAWREWAARNPDLSAGRLLGRACAHLSPAECAAYDAPYPDARYKAGVRRFPQLVPDRPDAPGAAVSRAARAFWRSRWDGESLMAIGMQDPVFMPSVMRALQADIRGCEHVLEIGEAGHFVQEWGAAVAHAAVRRFALGT